MTQTEILEAVISSIPYPDQIKNINLDSSGFAIRFTWRRGIYRVSDTLMVEEVRDGCLVGSDNAILMEHLIKKSRVLSTL